MHPPLDRPHPDCQEEIQNLRHCHATNSKLKFWACNEVKWKLDKCFKAEKERMLKEMNKDVDQRRLEDDEQSAKATGKNITFEQFLATDSVYRKELEEIKKKKSRTWFG